MVMTSQHHCPMLSRVAPLCSKRLQMPDLRLQMLRLVLLPQHGPRMPLVGHGRPVLIHLTDVPDCCQWLTWPCSCQSHHVLVASMLIIKLLFPLAAS